MLTILLVLEDLMIYHTFINWHMKFQDDSIYQQYMFKMVNYQEMYTDPWLLFWIIYFYKKLILSYIKFLDQLFFYLKHLINHQLLLDIVLYQYIYYFFILKSLHFDHLFLMLNLNNIKLCHNPLKVYKLNLFL